MNKTVTASGMTVSAKSDNTFLLIGQEDEELDAIQGAPGEHKDIVATETDVALFPAQFTTEAITAEKPLTNDATYTADANTWYTRLNGNADSATDDMQKATAVETDDEDYMLKNTYHLCLTQSSSDWTGLKITWTSEDKTDLSITSVVKVGDTYVKMGGNTNVNEYTFSDAVIKGTEVTDVVVYTYINGDYETVKSVTDLATLTGTVNLKFDLVD